MKKDDRRKKEARKKVEEGQNSKYVQTWRK
jgi:hypothetical protein